MCALVMKLMPNNSNLDSVGALAEDASDHGKSPSTATDAHSAPEVVEATADHQPFSELAPNSQITKQFFFYFLTLLGRF